MSFVVVIVIAERSFLFLKDKEPRGIITLENVLVRSMEDKARPNTFEIYTKAGEIINACKMGSEGRLNPTSHSSYRIAASSREDMESWINSIK